MTGPTHAILGIAATVAWARLTGDVPRATEFLVMFIGSLAPDIDGDGSISKPGRLFQVFLGYRIGRFLDQIFAVISGLINFIFSHRGFIHSAFIPMGFLVAGIYLKNSYLWWFGFGYATHLAADFMTVFGIPAFSPFTDKKYSGSPIRTGSASEGIVAACFFFYMVIFGWPLLPEKVKAAHIQMIEFIKKDNRDKRL